eukprot:scaffold19854_cov64-Phaeocystis_antarctica.AAC.7
MSCAPRACTARRASAKSEKRRQETTNLCGRTTITLEAGRPASLSSSGTKRLPSATSDRLQSILDFQAEK